MPESASRGPGIHPGSAPRWGRGGWGSFSAPLPCMGRPFPPSETRPHPLRSGHPAPFRPFSRKPLQAPRRAHGPPRASCPSVSPQPVGGAQSSPAPSTTAAPSQHNTRPEGGSNALALSFLRSGLGQDVAAAERQQRPLGALGSGTIWLLVPRDGWEPRGPCVAGPETSRLQPDQ